jgi:hypothetical protein
MNKRIRIGVLSAILAAGSIAGVTQIGGVANAQVDDTAAAAQTDETTTTDPATDDTTADDTTADDTTDVDRDADHEARHAAREADTQAIADLLGVEVEDLKEQLRSGTTLSEIATANGVEVSAVVDLIVQQKTARIDQAVADGRITAEQAAERKVGLAERVQTGVEEGRPEGGRGHRGDRGGRGPGCADGATDDATTEDATTEADAPVVDTPVETDGGS